MEFILTALVVVLGFSLLRLRGRVDQIEYQLSLYERTNDLVSESEDGTTSVPAASTSGVMPSDSIASVPLRAVPFVDYGVPPSPFVPTVVDVPAPSLYTPEAYREMVVTEPSEFFLVTWFKEQTLIKIGALIFFLGAVWFVSYAISLGLIPVGVRIFIGLCVAVLFYGAGIWRSSVEPQQYLVLTTLGTAIVMVTVFSAQFFFATALFATPFALALIVASIAYTVYTSIRTSTEWLAIASALAGLSAPFLIGNDANDPTMFMLYLLAFAASFSTVVLFTNWRTLSVVLVVGVSWFELMGLHHVADGVMWICMILFAILFLVMTTVSLYRSAEPEPADILLLAIAGSVFTYGAYTIAVLPGLALFIAAFVLAAIGYGASIYQAPKRVIAVYICFSSAAWLIGTSLVFSGFTQLLALTIEITLAFLIVTDLRFSPRAIYLSLATFVIPVVSSFSVLFSDAWQQGVWQLDCLASVVVTLALLGSLLWVLERPLLRGEVWAMPVARVLGVVGFLYTLTLLAQIATSAFVPGSVVTYVLWMVFILISLGYVISSRLPDSWATTLCGMTALPVIASVESLTSSVWEAGKIFSSDALGVYSMIIFSCLLTALLGTWYRQTGTAYYRTLTRIAAVGTVLYVFATIAIFWSGLLPLATASVLTYASYALILYGILSACWHLRSPFPTVFVVTAAGILPVIMSLKSLDVSLWQGSVLQPQAAGLYVMTTLCFVTAMRFLVYQTDDSTLQVVIKRFSTALFVFTGLYGVALVWIIAHVLSASNSMAVTVALFVYTVAGLGLYVIGSSRAVLGLKYAGMTLLAVVVVRLGVVEVWVMDILWRIVTFLGIGLLFMLAALLEKKK